MRILSVPIAEAAPDPKSVWITELGNCESTGSTTLKILDVNDRYSYGELMFQMSTWLRYSKQFGTTPGNIYDPALQETVARYMLDNGGESNWYTCSRKTATKMGAYPG